MGYLGYESRQAAIEKNQQEWARSRETEWSEGGATIKTKHGNASSQLLTCTQLEVKL